MKNIEACTDTIVNDLYSLLKIEGLPIVEISKPRHYWFIRTQGGSYFDEFFLMNLSALVMKMFLA